MDALYFLKERTRFIRHLYENASHPFADRMRRIDAGEEPFVPPYSENGDPPFEFEWQEAEESLDVLGQMCVSALATRLKLYLVVSVEQLHDLRAGGLAGIGRPEDDKGAFKKGWLNGYRTYFQKLGILWESAPVDLDLIEEVVLTRNRAQHSDDITTTRIRQTPQDLRKRPSFFADDFEVHLLQDLRDPSVSADEWPLVPWRLKITKEKLFKVIEETEHFCEWLEQQLDAWLKAGLKPAF